MLTRRSNVMSFVGMLGVASFASIAVAAETRPAPTDGIELAGLVSDDVGEPLVGATVSVFGRNLAKGAATVVTGADGRFQLSNIPPGTYRLRAYLTGFLPSAFASVLVGEGIERVGSVLISLSRLQAADGYAEDSAKGRKLAELRWIVQHQERNVLKEEERAIQTVELTHWEEAPGFDPDFDWSGEFGVRAATYDAGLDEFPGAGEGLDARLAFARLFIPAGNDGHWLVSAQVLESALSSWAGRAEYVTGGVTGHRLSGGVTYGNFLYGDLQAFRPPEAALARSMPGDRSAEWFGSVYASDAFLLGSASIDAGIAFQYFDYLDEGNIASPRLTVAYPLGSGERTWLRGGVDYRVLAPGGEDIGLLSRVAFADVYGPTPARHSLRAERTARFGIAMEHILASRTRLAVRVFQENASDQLVKAFSRSGTASDAGHFVVRNAGDFETRGVGVELTQSIGAVEGSVGYAFGKTISPETALLSAEADGEIHDFTTRLATSIERTQTRVQAAYRLIHHPGVFGRPAGVASGAELESRFSVQVFQLLPFVGWNGTQWELMMAVRNLFYDEIEKASILDEIAVVDAPRRVLGGVTVRF
jgi:hypothetical protein